MMDIHEITEQAFDYKGIKIQPLRVKHLELPIFGYRVGQFAYITDASSISDETMKLLENVEVLVINALRFKPHYSHFCVAQALEIIEKIKPKQAYLTHPSATNRFTLSLWLCGAFSASQTGALSH